MTTGPRNQGQQSEHPLQVYQDKNSTLKVDYSGCRGNRHALTPCGPLAQLAQRLHGGTPCLTVTGGWFWSVSGGDPRSLARF